MVNVPSIKKDIREVEASDLKGFEAVLHLAALSNDPLGNLNPDLTYDINHRASVRLAELAKKAGVQAICLLQLLQQLRRGRRRFPRRIVGLQPGHALRPIEGQRRARSDADGRRPLLPDVSPQRHRLRRLAAAALRPGAQ